MAKEEYEFVPTKEFNKLSDELAKLKENPFLTKTQSKDMKNSIEDLNGSVHSLLELMKLAHQDMSMEEREEKILKKQLEPLMKRFDQIEDNQETIANGVVLVSEAVSKLTHKLNQVASDIERHREKKEEGPTPHSDGPSRKVLTKRTMTTRTTPQVGLPQFQQFTNSQLPPTSTTSQESSMDIPQSQSQGGSYRDMNQQGMPPPPQYAQYGSQQSQPPQQPANSQPPTPPPAPEPAKKHSLFGKK